MSDGEMPRLPDIGLQPLLERVDEVGDCLVWNCYALDGLHPQWRIGGQGGRLWNVRRLLWLLVRGPVEEGFQIGVNCTTDLCVHPDHLAARTRSQACAGKPTAPDHRIRIAIARRARATLTADVVNAIRASTESCVVLDERHGLSRGYSSQIRKGNKWRQAGGHFEGLGGRRAS